MADRVLFPGTPEHTAATEARHRQILAMSPEEHERLAALAYTHHTPGADTYNEAQTHLLWAIAKRLKRAEGERRD